MNYLPQSQTPDAKTAKAATDSPLPWLVKTSLSNSRMHRELAALAVARIARSDPRMAAEQLEKIAARLQAGEKGWAWTQIGWQAAQKHMPEALDAYRKAGDAPLSDEVAQWKVRAALRAQDWPTVRSTIEKMPPALAEQPAWIYWLGRAYRAGGRIEDANAMLGAPYCIDWPVRHGKGIGTSKLGKPTINQNYPADALQPCTGVYLTRIWLDGRWWPSATGIGRRPTVDAANAPVTCETYVPGYHGDTYGQTPVLEFHHYLCAVRKFGTLQELADLIETAAQQSIAYFAAKEEA